MQFQNQIVGQPYALPLHSANHQRANSSISAKHHSLFHSNTQPPQPCTNSPQTTPQTHHNISMQNQTIPLTALQAPHIRPIEILTISTRNLLLKTAAPSLFLFISYPKPHSTILLSSGPRTKRERETYLVSSKVEPWELQSASCKIFCFGPQAEGENREQVPPFCTSSSAPFTSNQPKSTPPQHHSSRNSGTRTNKPAREAERKERKISRFSCVS